MPVHGGPRVARARGSDAGNRLGATGLFSPSVEQLGLRRCHALLSYWSVALAVAAGPLAATPGSLADLLDGFQPACHTDVEIKPVADGAVRRRSRRRSGLQSNGALIQVFASKDGMTWTIISTRPDGVSCIVALGQHWEALQAHAMGRWPEARRCRAGAIGRRCGAFYFTRENLRPVNPPVTRCMAKCRCAPRGGA